MLGNNCNCNCKYCLQKKDNTLPSIMNEDIFTFIEKEISKERKNKLQILFYGGEPLLYIDTIREFLRRLRTRANYSIITNGKSLDMSIVNLLNRYNFNVTVSWDGKNSSKSRNYDVVADKKELLMKINHLCFSAVVNHYAYPKDILNDINEINKDYRKYHRNDIRFNIDSLYNFNNDINSVFNINKKKLSKQMKDMLIGYNTTNLEIENTYIKIINDICTPKNNEIYSMCGNGIYTLNMDLQGNLYLCHNDYSKKLGTIYSDTDDYIDKYNSYYSIEKRFVERCNDCKIKTFCKGGCMILKDENMEEYCSQRKAMFECFFELFGKLADIKEK